MKRTTRDHIAMSVAPAELRARARPLVLLGAGALALLVLLHAETAGADNCDSARQTCASEGQQFCGGPRLAGCLYTCCPDAGCCLFYDNIGVNGAQCCPSDPNLDAACTPGCQYTCKRPCGPHTCCSTTLNEQCIPAAGPNAEGTCCPSTAVVCGIAFPTCCAPPNVCTPAGSCCPSADDVLCGNEECCHGVCCNGQCCAANSACYGNRVCCPQSLKPCGDTCCARNEKCRQHKRKPPICKCKKKGKKCGGTRCCAGDVCDHGLCLPPLP